MVISLFEARGLGSQEPSSLAAVVKVHPVLSTVNSYIEWFYLGRLTGVWNRKAHQNTTRNSIWDAVSGQVLEL